MIEASIAAGREPWQIWYLFAFRPEINSHLASFTEGVMRAPAPICAGLRDLGWDDEAIYYTILVVSLFNFYNRWVTTSGVHPVSGIHRLHGKRLAQSGYEPKTRLPSMRA